MALESILHRIYTHQSDVWSYGEFKSSYNYCRCDGKCQDLLVTLNGDSKLTFLLCIVRSTRDHIYKHSTQITYSTK